MSSLQNLRATSYTSATAMTGDFIRRRR
uniref:Uncharacterized protein n=1 Tax=Anguilla anguilla TaxID=7936 RepID=A0A0E9RLM7_ANGAN